MPVMRALIARPRSPALAQFVESLHYHPCEITMALERILPAGRIHLTSSPA